MNSEVLKLVHDTVFGFSPLSAMYLIGGVCLSVDVMHLEFKLLVFITFLFMQEIPRDHPIWWSRNHKFHILAKIFFIFSLLKSLGTSMMRASYVNYFVHVASMSKLSKELLTEIFPIMYPQNRSSLTMFTSNCAVQ